jgi:protease-4
MSDSKHWLLDREILKREIFKWRLLFAVLAFLVLIFVANDNKLNKGLNSLKSEKYIARITLKDIIYDNAYNLDVLDEIKDDDHAVALIVAIDSPGSTTTAGESIYYRIRKIAQKKPVVAIMDSVGASGAYLISVAADRIFAKNGTITGSIGVIYQAYEFSNLAEKMGVGLITIKSSPLKGGINQFEKASPELIDSTKQLVSDSYRQISDIIVERRKYNQDQFDKVKDGRALLGDRALKLGLIDQIGETEEALKWLETHKKISSGLPIVDIEIKHKQDKFGEYFSKIFGTTLNKYNGPKLLAIME